MTFSLESVNWLAVVVAAVATFFLGGLWYQALFGKLWVKLHGYSEEKVAQMRAAKPPALFFGGMVAAYFLLAIVLSVFINATATTTWSGGAMLGFLLWLGPAMAMGFTAWLASDRVIGVFILDWAYQLVFLVMMGAILGAWH
ncbi:MAG: DUF1761 domain-containing protein [Phycisphaerales bacterium]